LADDNTSSIGALNQRSVLLRISSLPTSSTRMDGISVIPSSTATSLARKRANGRARRRSTMSLMTLRARTKTSATSIVRSAIDSAYSTTSVRKSGDSLAVRRARVTSATSATTSRRMPASSSRGLSRMGRRVVRGGGVGRDAAMRPTRGC
jgi:hypothetical protein